MNLQNWCKGVVVSQRLKAEWSCCVLQLTILQSWRLYTVIVEVWRVWTFSSSLFILHTATSVTLNAHKMSATPQFPQINVQWCQKLLIHFSEIHYSGYDASGKTSSGRPCVHWVKRLFKWSSGEHMDDEMMSQDGIRRQKSLRAASRKNDDHLWKQRQSQPDAADRTDLH